MSTGLYDQRVRLYGGADSTADSAFASVGYAYRETRWMSWVETAGNEATVGGQAQQNVDAVGTMDDDGRPLNEQVDVNGGARPEDGRFYKITNAARHPLLREILVTAVYADAAGVTTTGDPAAAVVPAFTVVTLSATTAYVGSTAPTATAVVGPSGASQAGAWSSSDPSVATIDAATGVITPLVEGIVTFTFTPTGYPGAAGTSAALTVHGATSVGAAPAPVVGRTTRLVWGVDGAWPDYFTGDLIFSPGAGFSGRGPRFVENAGPVETAGQGWRTAFSHTTADWTADSGSPVILVYPSAPPTIAAGLPADAPFPAAPHYTVTAADASNAYCHVGRIRPSDAGEFAACGGRYSVLVGLRALSSAGVGKHVRVKLGSADTATYIDPDVVEATLSLAWTWWAVDRTFATRADATDLAVILYSDFRTSGASMTNAAPAYGVCNAYAQPGPVIDDARFGMAGRVGYVSTSGPDTGNPVSDPAEGHRFFAQHLPVERAAASRPVGAPGHATGPTANPGGLFVSAGQRNELTSSDDLTDAVGWSGTGTGATAAASPRLLPYDRERPGAVFTRLTLAVGSARVSPAATLIDSTRTPASAAGHHVAVGAVFKPTVDGAALPAGLAVEWRVAAKPAGHYVLPIDPATIGPQGGWRGTLAIDADDASTVGTLLLRNDGAASAALDAAALWLMRDPINTASSYRNEGTPQQRIGLLTTGGAPIEADVTRVILGPQAKLHTRAAGTKLLLLRLPYDPALLPRATGLGPDGLANYYTKVVRDTGPTASALFTFVIKFESNATLTDAPWRFVAAMSSGMAGTRDAAYTRTMTPGLLPAYADVGIALRWSAGAFLSVWLGVVGDGVVSGAWDATGATVNAGADDSWDFTSGHEYASTDRDFDSVLGGLEVGYRNETNYVLTEDECVAALVDLRRRARGEA